MATPYAMNARLKPYLAEFAGTYLLVLFAAGAVVVTTMIDGSPSALVCGLSSGLVLTAVIWALALSLALAYLGRLSWRQFPGYVLAQLAGSACACLTLLWTLGDFGAVGANLPNATLGISGGAAFGLEAILSFIMMLAILLCGDAELVGPLEDAQREGEVGLALDAGELRRGVEALPLRRVEDVHSRHGWT